jgi:hypothetical protein
VHAPQGIANRFFTELTDGKRTKITDGFEEDQDTIGSGKGCHAFSLTDDRGVGLDYVSDVRGEGNNKSITIRITELDVDA